jgi:hypothetical protein
MYPLTTALFSAGEISRAYDRHADAFQLNRFLDVDGPPRSPVLARVPPALTTDAFVMLTAMGSSPAFSMPCPNSRSAVGRARGAG